MRENLIIVQCSGRIIFNCKLRIDVDAYSEKDFELWIDKWLKNSARVQNFEKVLIARLTFKFSWKQGIIHSNDSSKTRNAVYILFVVHSPLFVEGLTHCTHVSSWSEFLYQCMIILFMFRMIYKWQKKKISTFQLVPFFFFDFMKFFIACDFNSLSR